MKNNLRKPVIETTKYNIKAPVEKDIKIVFISDLHEYCISPILAQVKKAVPDIVLLGGDIIHSTTQSKNGIAFLEQVSKISPTFCSIGNHERIFDGDIYSLFVNCGVVPLDNAAVQYRDINIGGLSSPLSKKYFEEETDSDKQEKIPDLIWLDEFNRISGYKILMCHQPEFFDKYIRHFDIDLILSGHAHGGQWRIGNQGIFAPGQGFFPKYTAGMHEDRLIISRGIGNAYLIPRINNKPEIIFLTLSAISKMQ